MWRHCSLYYDPDTFDLYLMPLSFLSALSFIFGLNLPRSFSLLYILLTAFYFIGNREIVSRWRSLPIPILFASYMLLFFGISYTIMQIVNRVWFPTSSYIAEILAITILPCACLVAGYLSSIRLSDLGKMILYFSLGSLVYALLSVLISHQPWYNFMQVFSHVLKAPWGEQDYLSVRAVEQRAFLAICISPAILTLKAEQPLKRLFCISGFLTLFTLGLYVTHSTNTRLIWPALFMSLLPLVWLIKKALARWLAFIVIGTASIVSIISGKICDERVWLQFEFIRNASQSLIGGRQITFRYRDCVPNGFNNFGSFEGANTFTPHNVFLDIYNDTGVIPFLFFTLAFISIFADLATRLYKLFFMSHSGSVQLYLLWAFISVYLSQLILQPFLYTDQLYMTVGIFVFGCAISSINQKDT